MRRFISIRLMALAASIPLAALPPARAAAACRVTTVAACDEPNRAVAADVVAVPVAVSVGVPVAEAAPYCYSYQALAPQSLVSSDAVEAIAAKVVEKLRQPTVGGASSARSPLCRNRQ